jgi:hypothetical protein
MANTALSRRVGKVVAYPPLSEMSEDQRRELHEALLDADCFEDLPGKWQAAILKAEQNQPNLRVVSNALVLSQSGPVSLAHGVEDLVGASLRPLVVDVEDDFRLGVRRLASAHLVDRRVQILSHEALKGVARIPALDDSPRPLCLSGGMESHPLVSAGVHRLLPDGVIGLLVDGWIPDDTDRHLASSSRDGSTLPSVDTPI